MPRTSGGRVTPKGRKPVERRARRGHAPRFRSIKELAAQGLIAGDGMVAIGCSCGWMAATDATPIVAGVPPERIGETSKEKALRLFAEHTGAPVAGHVSSAARAVPEPKPSNLGPWWCDCGWSLDEGVSEQRALAEFERHRTTHEAA